MNIDLKSLPSEPDILHKIILLENKRAIEKCINMRF
jgi:hypothetical protein